MAADSWYSPCIVRTPHSPASPQGMKFRLRFIQGGQLAIDLQGFRVIALVEVDSRQVLFGAVGPVRGFVTEIVDHALPRLLGPHSAGVEPLLGNRLLTGNRGPQVIDATQQRRLLDDEPGRRAPHARKHASTAPPRLPSGSDDAPSPPPFSSARPAAAWLRCTARWSPNPSLPSSQPGRSSGQIGRNARSAPAAARGAAPGPIGKRFAGVLGQHLVDDATQGGRECRGGGSPAAGAASSGAARPRPRPSRREKGGTPASMW